MKIGAWTVEPDLNLLKRGTLSLKLSPRVMDVLVYLAHRSGRVVPVDELIDSIWEGRIPDDTQVYKAITKLRKALGDQRENACYIETIPKRGYRLVAPVSVFESESLGARFSRAERDSARRRFVFRLVVAGVVAATLASLLYRPMTEEGAAGRFDPAVMSSPGYPSYLQAISTTTCCPVIEYLDEAIALDPEFGLAYATKAYSIAYRTGWSDRAQRERLVLENANRALQLDPTLGLAHAARAFVHMTNLDWAEAERAFHEAIRWSPDEPGVWLLHGRFKRYRHQEREAIRSGKRAAELDPTSHVAHFHLGASYRRAGDLDHAAAAFRRAIELNPAMVNARFQLAATEIVRGNDHAALRQLQLCDKFFAASEFYDGAPDWRVAQLAYAYAQLGFHDDAKRLTTRLAELGTLSPASWVMVHLATGNPERALHWLERAIDETPSDVIALGVIRANAYSDPVLEEPLFAALRTQISAF